MKFEEVLDSYKHMGLKCDWCGLQSRNFMMHLQAWTDPEAKRKQLKCIYRVLRRKRIKILERGKRGTITRCESNDLCRGLLHDQIHHNVGDWPGFHEVIC